MFLKAVLICILVIILQHVGKLIYLKDYHKTVYNHTPGPCKIIPGIEHGSEDMETLPSGLTFITSGWTNPPLLTDNNKQFRLEMGVKGRIYSFDFNTPQNGVNDVEILDFDQSDFFPHGISVYQNTQTGKITVFVVNHGSKEDSIEKFQYLPNEEKLRHIRSYKSNTMITCNDVVAVSEDSFYFTNTMYFRSNFGLVLEFFLMLSYGSVGFFDGDKYKIVLDGLSSPNGLILSANQKFLYLLADGGLSIYSRQDNGLLQLINTKPLYTYPDNPSLVRESGNIVLGAHPINHMLMEHVENPNSPSPSQVLMLHLKDESNITAVTELYSDEGRTLYGSSVASIWRNRMLIGTVQHKLMYCDVKIM